MELIQKQEQVIVINDCWDAQSGSKKIKKKAESNKREAERISYKCILNRGNKQTALHNPPISAGS